MTKEKTAAALLEALVSSVTGGEPFISVAFRLAAEMNKSREMGPEEFREKSSGFTAKFLADLTGRSVNTINRYRSAMKAPPDVAATIETLYQLKFGAKKMSKHAAEALKLAREKGLKPGDLVPVAIYDEESFPILRNPDGMSLIEYNAVVEDIISTFTENGYKAVPVKITVSEYKVWLGEELNTPSKRAEFVAEKISKAN